MTAASCTNTWLPERHDPRTHETGCIPIFIQVSSMSPSGTRQRARSASPGLTATTPRPQRPVAGFGICESWFEVRLRLRRCRRCCPCCRTTADRPPSHERRIPTHDPADRSVRGGLAERRAQPDLAGAPPSGAESQPLRHGDTTGFTEHTAPLRSRRRPVGRSAPRLSLCLHTSLVRSFREYAPQSISPSNDPPAYRLLCTSGFAVRGMPLLLLLSSSVREPRTADLRPVS